MPELDELVLDGDPAAVPRARRFARDVAARLASDVSIDDVELVVSELVTNAVLHGAPPVHVWIWRKGSTVRVEVSDRGSRSPAPALSGPDNMTGRGLSLVAAVTEQWGVDSLPHGGKVVWAELSGEAPDGATRLRGIDGFIEEAEEEPSAYAEKRFVVRLGPVPTGLLVEAKAHMDNVARELTLVGEGGFPDTPLAIPVRDLIAALTHDFAEPRAQMKRQAQAAVRRGEPETELVLELPASAAGAAERYLAALEEADHQARSAQMLTLAAPGPHRVFRRWYLRSVMDQLRGMAGEAPPASYVTFTDALVEEVDHLSEVRDAWARLQLLQKVTGGLSACTSVSEVASTVADNALEFLGAMVVRVFVLDDDQILRSVAARGGVPELERQFRNLPLDGDYPASEVVRTGEPMTLRNRAEIERAIPLVQGYPYDRVLHILPVQSAGRPIGCITLTFPAVTRIEETYQASFLAALADALAPPLHKAMISDRLNEANRRIRELERP